MTTCLVCGASGAVGRFLLPRLLDAGHEVIAVSRSPRTSTRAGLRWTVGDLDRGLPMPVGVEAILSLGPLDAFSRWLASSSAPSSLRRVIAFGSMSIDSKRASRDPHERDMVARLVEGERSLIAAATARGASWTVLRPTLVYGAGIDRNLTPLARFVQRWRVLPRLSGAHGLRQPVHADDLAGACVAVLAQAREPGRTYPLGGGERIGFGEMLERVRRSAAMPTLAVPLPLGVARALADIAARVGVPIASAAAFERLDSDLVADHAAAVADFGWAPRGFAPTAATWTVQALPA